MRALLLSLLVVLGAAGASWLSARRAFARASQSATAASRMPLRPADTRIEELTQRIADLEARKAIVPVLEARERQPVQASTSARTDESAALELAKRITALEQRVNALIQGKTTTSIEQDLLETHAARTQEVLDKLARHQALRESMGAIINDPNASPAEKIAAHDQLRRVPDAYTDQMVSSLIDLAASDVEPKLRARVWTNFDGNSIVPGLVTPLLEAAHHDSSDQVRREAVETLGNYGNDPLVLQTLKDLAQNDPSGKVRKIAKRTLKGVVQGQ